MKYGITATMAAALALAACSPKSSETVTTVNETATNEVAAAPMDAAPAVSAGQAFANTAGASDMFEIETSKLATTNANSAAVKDFANKMIAAHNESTAKLKAAGAAATPAITPDPTLSADQQQKLDALKAAKGADFDKLYADDQKAAHQMTLDALRAYSASGDVPALKGFATDMVPIVTAHLNMANALKP